MVTFNEFLTRRSIFHFIVLAAFAIAAAIFVINKGLETVSDIETIENAPILTLRKQLLEDRGDGGALDIRKWRVYRNSDYGFEVRFPADYRLAAKNIELAPSSEDEGGLVIVDAGRKILDEEGRSISGEICSLQLAVGENPDRLTLTEWVRRRDVRVPSSEEFISIDGESALRLVGSDRAGHQYTEVHISYQNRVFTFVLSVDTSGRQSGQCREEFDLILSTVKFIR